MVWDGIYLRNGCGYKSPLVMMKRDQPRPGAKKGGYTSWSYIKVLKKGLLPIYRDNVNWQQDNALIHACAKTTEWLYSRGMTFIDWPPHSPDLNLIKHVWRVMKAILEKRGAPIFDLKNNKVDMALFRSKITAAWEAIPEGLIRRLILNLEDRLKEVIKARGWYTHY
jgi:hypothetical protein